MTLWMQSVGRQLLAAIMDNLALLLATGLYLMSAQAANVYLYDGAALRGDLNWHRKLDYWERPTIWRFWSICPST